MTTGRAHRTPDFFRTSQRTSDLRVSTFIYVLRLLFPKGWTSNSLKMGFAADRILDEHVCEDRKRNATMWVELYNEEVALVLDRVEDPSIAEKLKALQHADTAAFRKAADCFSDFVHVHDDAPIERTHKGAYVLTWLWMPNERAGFPRLNDFDDYDSNECSR